LYFDGSANDYVTFSQKFVLNHDFSIHSWVYTFTNTNRDDDMILFTKYIDNDVNGNEQDFFSVGVNEDLEMQVGLIPSLDHNDAQLEHDERSTSDQVRLPEDRWVYV